MPINDPAALTPRRKPCKIADGRGLYLHIMPTGAKYWRFRYRFAGKLNNLSCVVFPAVQLKEARARCNQLRQVLADGLDPSSYVKHERRASLDAQRQQERMRFTVNDGGSIGYPVGNPPRRSIPTRNGGAPCVSGRH
jgi:hypothetical protein